MHSISTHPRFPVGERGVSHAKWERETEGSGFCGGGKGKKEETDQFRFLLWMETYRDRPRPIFNEEEESLGLKGNSMSSENEFCFLTQCHHTIWYLSSGITSGSQEFFWKTGELRGICSKLPKLQKNTKGRLIRLPNCFAAVLLLLLFSLSSLPRCRNFGYRRILPWKRGEPFHSLCLLFNPPPLSLEVGGGGGTKPACLLQPPSPPSSLGYKISCWNFPPLLSSPSIPLLCATP